jgi:hypothetical protein
MSTGLTAVNVNTDATFCYAGDKVEHLLGQALQLDAADPKHISIVVEMAQALASPFYKNLHLSCTNIYVESCIFALCAADHICAPHGALCCSRVV